MASYIEHAAYKVSDPDWYLTLFDKAFGMGIQREQTGADGLRQIWLVGGVQLCETAEPQTADGRCDHLCLLTDDLEAARTEALALGCTALPKHHWVMTPDGLRLELFTAADGTVEALKAVPKRKA